MLLDATTIGDAKVVLLEDFPQPDPVDGVRLSFATSTFHDVAVSHWIGGCEWRNPRHDQSGSVT